MKLRKTALIFGLLASISGLDTNLTHAAETMPAYQLVRTVSLGGPDRWDYVTYDSVQHRVYVAHGAETTVVDSETGKLIGRIKSGGTGHGIVVLPALNLGFADNSDPSSVTVFNLDTLKIIKKIALKAADSDAMTYDPASQRVVVIGGDSGVVTLIDPVSLRVTASIPLGGKAESPAVDGHGNLYVNLVDDQEVVRVNTQSLKVTARWKISQCAKPHGLAMDVAHQRLFATCHNNRMLVLDSANGHVLDSLPIGSGSDAAVFDAKRGIAFSSNRDGTLSMIAERNPQSFDALTPVKTAPGARTMAIDPETSRVFVVTGDVDSTSNASKMHFKPDSLHLMTYEAQP